MTERKATRRCNEIAGLADGSVVCIGDDCPYHGGAAERRSRGCPTHPIFECMDEVRAVRGDPADD
jgi:hypothetical protein